jgi:hypothetical protein
MPTTTPQLERRLATISNSAKSWLRMDYDAINLALSCAINPEMGPLHVKRALEARLKEMSVRDRGHIPIMIWSLLDALDVTGSGNFQQYNPVTPSEGSENRSGWFSVRKAPPNVVHITPRKVAPIRFIKSLRAKPRFAAWEARYKPMITRTADELTIRCPILTDLPADFCQQLFEDF